MTGDNGAQDHERPQDGTLGGYFQVHDRPPRSRARTATRTRSRSKSSRPETSWPPTGLLVFPRWAQTGVGIVGHAESPTLVECRSHREAEERLGALTLVEVQRILEDAVARAQHTE